MAYVWSVATADLDGVAQRARALAGARFIVAPAREAYHEHVVSTVQA